QVLRRPSFCRLSSSCPLIPNHLVHGAAAVGAGQGGVPAHGSHSQPAVHPVSAQHGQTAASAASASSSTGAAPLNAFASQHQQQQQPDSQPHMSTSQLTHQGQPSMHPSNEAARLMVNSKGSSVSNSALDSVALRSSPAGDEDDDDAINNVKILVNDITPASSQEFLQASNPSSRRSSASDVRHSPSQGNSIGGNTAQRLAKRGQLHGQSPESPRRQSWSDLSKAGSGIGQIGVGNVIGCHGTTSPLLHGTTGSPKAGNNRRAHKSPIKLQRSVSLNSLESAECDEGGPDSASNSSSELHTSNTGKGAALPSTVTVGSAGAAVSSDGRTSADQTATGGRSAVVAPGAGKPPSGAQSHVSQAATTSGSYAGGGGGGRAGSPGVPQGPVPAAAGAGGSGAPPRGQLPPLQLPLSSEHNYSMQPPPSPRQHRSASSGEAMLLLHRCHEELSQSSAQISAAAVPSGGATCGTGPPPVPPKFAKPLPPGVLLSKKLPPPSLQKSISTPSIVVAQETLLQHSQSDRKQRPLQFLPDIRSGFAPGQILTRSVASSHAAPPAAGHHPQPSQTSPRLNPPPPHKSSLLHSQRSIVYLLEEEDEQPDAPHVQDCVALICRSQYAAHLRYCPGLWICQTGMWPDFPGCLEKVTLLGDRAGGLSRLESERLLGRLL
ncbi:hypothetical protein BIW11_10698, partial [Tropilaelaps mercedesae]